MKKNLTKWQLALAIFTANEIAERLNVSAKRVYGWRAGREPNALLKTMLVGMVNWLTEEELNSRKEAAEICEEE